MPRDSVLRADVLVIGAPDGSATGLAKASASSLRDHLRAAIADDFARDRIVDVAGWRLPLTEARVAALVYQTR